MKFFEQLKFGTNFWIIFSTIVLIGIVYLFYIKVYIAEKESRIISSDFRVLNQIGVNIDVKLKGYSNNAKEFVNKDGDNNKSLVPITDSLDSLSKRTLDEKYKSSYAEYYFVPTADKVDTYTFKVSYDQLMDGLSRKDVFDDLILIKDTLIIYNSLGQDLKLMHAGTFSKIIQILKVKKEEARDNSLLSTESKNTYEDFIYSGETFDLTISNIKYKAFLKPIEANKEHWYIVGLTEKSKYNAASRSIAPGVIILLSVLLILIILGMPVIKLKVISKTEQLTTSTIINFAISTLLGGALITLFVFFVIENFSHRIEIDKKLKALTTDIDTNFTTEIIKSLEQLYDYDTVLTRSNNTDFKLGVNILKKDSLYYPKSYLYADLYFSVNKDGQQINGLTVKKKIGSPSNLSKRDYINKRDEWYLKRKKDTIKFRMESIVSVSSGAIKTAVSIPSTINESFPTIALTSRFYSIIDPIIPKNYSFCIIDKSGEVWFHSDKNRNLNENLIDECNENKYLKAALYRKTSKAINVDYYNKPHRIYVAPIEELPLYLVTFYNKQFDNSFQAQTVTLTMILFGSLLLMIFIQIAALLVIEGKNVNWTVTKNIIMRLSRPLKHLNSTYNYLLKVNIITFIIVIPWFIGLQDKLTILAIFTLVIYLFNYMYWVLNSNEKKIETRKWFTFINLIILILINITGYILIRGEGFLDIIIFQLVVALTLFVCHTFVKIKKGHQGNNYINNYTKFLLALLIMFGILPTLTFFKVAHNTELEIRTKHSQIDLMQQRENRNAAMNNYYKEIDSTYSSEVINSIHMKRKKLGIYTKFLNETCFDTTSHLLTGAKNNLWDTLVCYFRPFYDNEIIENKYLIFNSQKKSGISWNKESDTLTLEYTSLTEDPEYKKLLNRKIRTTIHGMQLYLPFHSKGNWSFQSLLFNTLFWIIVILLLIAFYFIIKYGVRKVFCLDVVEGYSHQAFFERIRHYLFTGNNLMITKLSDIDETNEFSKQLSSTVGFFYLDWSDEDVADNSIQIIESEWKNFCKDIKPETKKANTRDKNNDSLIIVIDNFDWNYHDARNFFNRISIIQQFDHRNEIIIIALSQISEITILKHLQNVIDQNIASGKDAGVLMKIRLSFENLLRKMEIIRQPINYYHSYIDEESYCGSTQITMETTELINEELSASDYLIQLKPAMNDYYTNQCKSINCYNKEERVLRRITQLAGRYYTDLLESCNIEEKYVLFDTADDLIINPKNEVSIIRLLKKGILVKKCNRINFMNVSFRRFVLQSLNKAETTQLQIKMGKATGTWKGYRTMLTIIIAALFLFIGIANQDFLANLNELFIAVAAGIAGVTGILSKLSANHNPSD